MKLVDTIATHPKLLRAAEIVGGETGLAEVLALYVAALGHSRHFLTDGYITHKFVTGSAISSRGEALANSLSDRRVKLWHRVKGGYRIHDFHDFNDKARAIKEKRRAEQARVAAYRAARNGGRT